MIIDWGLAGRIGGIGFGFVFFVLIILAVSIWLTGLIVSKTGANKGENGDRKKGE